MSMSAMINLYLSSGLMEIDTITRIHFIGIGGIGMSALARFFLHEGKQVSGSDRAASVITDALEREGVTFFPEQAAANITSDIEMVVYTEAMAQDHPEMLAAAALEVPMMNYFEALGVVANPYHLIAVAGTHGKTTTTAMLADILEEASLDPTVIVGSLRSKTGSNFRPGKSKYAIVEACEYKADFLALTPDVLVITNLEHEHVDYYQNLAEVQAVFRKLALQVREGGVVVADTADPNIAPVVADLPVRVVDYRQFLDLSIKLRAPGMHTRMNAAAAAAAAAAVGVEPKTANSALENFAGTWRRFEYKGMVNSAPVYDDYAHHPTEIAATIAGVRELYPSKKLTVIFQPHTYTRTAELFDEFVTALAKADTVLLVPIYAAREKNTSGISSEKLCAAVEQLGTPATAFHTLPAAALAAKELADPEQVFVVMGAGDVTKVAPDLMGLLS